MKHFVHGLLVVDKPGGMTSREVVDRCLCWFPPGTRLGHTGTLDPLATGVLVLCVGAATRLAEYVQRMEKTYQAGLLFGVQSDSDDADGTVTAVVVEAPPELAAVERELQTFLGAIQQVPPTVSAAKTSGQRAYRLARKGREVQLAARPVQIHAIEIVAFAYPRLELAVRCGKGTYIRALARDLGKHLGCGALVETLRRTRIGPFGVEGALSLETAAAQAVHGLLPMSAAVAELPRVTLDSGAAARMRRGQAVPAENASLVADVPEEALEVAVFGEAGSLVAVGRLDRANQRLQPIKVLPES